MYVPLITKYKSMSIQNIIRNLGFISLTIVFNIILFIQSHNVNVILTVVSFLINIANGVSFNFSKDVMRLQMRIYEQLAENLFGRFLQSKFLYL